MKRITAIALLAIANLAMAGTSLAQSNGVEAKIPFAFAVGNKVLPAGTYTIKPTSPQVILISDRYQTVSAFSLVNQDSTKSPNGGRLVFHKYAGQYFLSQILCDTANMNLELPASKREKTAQLQQARLGTSGGQTLVAAR
jgi:hypothetical protein